MSTELPKRTPLPASSDAAFDRVAELTRRVLGVPTALVSLVDSTRQVFPGAVGLPEPWQTQRTTPLSHSFCQYVVLRSEPLVVVDAREDDLLADNLAVPDLGVIAYAGMPLTQADGTVVGSLCAIDSRPREWTDTELTTLADLAAACSAELRLRTAADRATTSAERAETLLALSEGLATCNTVDQLVDTLALLVRERLGAASAVVRVADPDMSLLDTASQPRPTGPDSLDRPSPVTREAVYVAGSPGVDGEAPAGANAYLPLQIGSRLLGALTMTWDRPRSFGPDDQDLLEGLARYTAQTLDRALLMAERASARALQTALLPTLPQVDWVQLSGYYQPAHSADAVGGDWYDAFLLGNDRLAVTVGDVAGHDLTAAAAMGQLQAGLRALASELPGLPSTLLERLDHLMTQHPSHAFATVVTGVLQPREGGAASFTWANAGHPPPLLIQHEQPAVYLESTPELLLGMSEPRPRTSLTADLAPGSTVLLFTDGLFEHKDQDWTAALRLLAGLAERHRGLPLDDLVAAVAGQAPGDGSDDTVVLAARLDIA